MLRAIRIRLPVAVRVVVRGMIAIVALRKVLEIGTNSNCTQTRTHGPVHHRHSKENHHDLGARWANGDHEPDYTTCDARSILL